MKTKYIQLKCKYCEKIFKRESKNQPKYKKRIRAYCNKECSNKHNTQINTVISNCGFCDKVIKKTLSQSNKSKSGKLFCNSSCAASYNNKLKRKSRRSKIETKFYNLLVKEFPNLNILANNKTMLDGLEVDVSIPSLSLAIEWNGIVHFKPIYGQTKLSKIQDKDAKKLKIAANKDINLIIIPDLVSNDKILKQAFDDVKDIINKLLTQ